MSGKVRLHSAATKIEDMKLLNCCPARPTELNGTRLHIQWRKGLRFEPRCRIQSEPPLVRTRPAPKRTRVILHGPPYSLHGGV